MELDLRVSDRYTTLLGSDSIGTRDADPCDWYRLSANFIDCALCRSRLLQLLLLGVHLGHIERVISLVLDLDELLVGGLTDEEFCAIGDSHR